MTLNITIIGLELGLTGARDSSIGDVDISFLNKFLYFIQSLLQTALNQSMKNGLSLPQNPNLEISFENTELSHADGYIYFLANPKFDNIDIYGLLEK